MEDDLGMPSESDLGWAKGPRTAEWRVLDPWAISCYLSHSEDVIKNASADQLLRGRKDHIAK